MLSCTSSPERVAGLRVAGEIGACRGRSNLALVNKGLQHPTADVRPCGANSSPAPRISFVLVSVTGSAPSASRLVDGGRRLVVAGL